MTEKEKIELYNRIVEGKMDEDIAVFEDLHSLPFMNEEFHCQHFFIGMCSKGKTSGKYDYKDITFNAGDMCWILPDHILSHHYASEDYTVMSIFIKKSYFIELKKSGVLGKHIYIGNCVVHLTPELFTILYNSFKTIDRLTQIENPKLKEIISSTIRNISTITDYYIAKQIENLPEQNVEESKLFGKFYDAITEHFRESREVSFYAHLLCLTPKYFATIIKKNTGTAATEWINNYVIVEAKWQLMNEKHKSIQQVAYSLGFSEQSSFSRLFKKIVGMSPSEYRKQN